MTAKRPRRTYKHQHEGGPFAALVLQWRKERGLSQAKAAALLGVHLRTFQDWQYGRRKPSGLSLKLITAKLTEKP
jgi:DNA-binding transcriptional regulator YiaG